MILTKKRRLRLEIRQQTATLDRREKMRQSAAAFSRLEKTEEFQKARNIGFFWSLTDEIPTQEIIRKWSKKKKVYLPAIRGEKIEFVHYHEECMMEEGQFRILVPAGTTALPASELDLLIVPGVAFDKLGGRLGKGKGYYDRFMDSAGVYSIGVCMDHQLVEEIPAEPHDVRVNMVITPSSVIIPDRKGGQENARMIYIPCNDIALNDGPM